MDPDDNRFSVLASATIAVAAEIETANGSLVVVGDVTLAEPNSFHGGCGHRETVCPIMATHGPRS